MSTTSGFMRLKRDNALRAGIVAAVLLLSVHQVGVAQESVHNPNASSVTANPAATEIPPAKAENTRYRIGPGDVLDIRVFNKPQLSRDGVRVDGRGMIRMPLIEDEIQAACRTESELANDLTIRYKEYLRQPQVDVFVKDYQSQPVAVLGAVRAPSRFQLQRQVRLLELLSFAGGPSDAAGRTIQIVHTATPLICETTTPTGSAGATLSIVENYKLSDTSRGDENANPYVLPGDIISVADAEQAFVVGNVLRPSPIVLKERITVTRAIAMSGGLMPDAKSSRVRIVRQAPGSTSATELFVDLKAIDKHKAEDVVLQAGDIVDVPTSAGKRLLRTLVGAIVPSAGQLPVRVIPIR